MNKEAFYNKCIPEPNTECWLWSLRVNKDGYGKVNFKVGNKLSTKQAHRYSWELSFGPIPDKKQVLHSCDVPSCVNPDHLWVGTIDDNHLDMAKKNRGIKSKIGYPFGVVRNGNRFVATFGLLGKVYYSGSFGTAEDAGLASEIKKKEVLGGLCAPAQASQAT